VDCPTRRCRRSTIPHCSFRPATDLAAIVVTTRPGGVRPEFPVEIQADAQILLIGNRWLPAWRTRGGVVSEKTVARSRGNDGEQRGLEISQLTHSSRSSKPSAELVN
jgi:hypothetical protein